MQKIMFILGICLAIFITAVVAYTGSDAPKTYVMSATDMKAVNGGDDYYEDNKCMYEGNHDCNDPCTAHLISWCEPGYPVHLCVVTYRVQYPCDGSPSCQVPWSDPKGPCVSYPD